MSKSIVENIELLNNYRLFLFIDVENLIENVINYKLMPIVVDKCVHIMRKTNSFHFPWVMIFPIYEWRIFNTPLHSGLQLPINSNR